MAPISRQCARCVASRWVRISTFCVESHCRLRTRFDHSSATTASSSVALHASPQGHCGELYDAMNFNWSGRDKSRDFGSVDLNSHMSMERNTHTASPDSSRSPARSRMRQEFLGCVVVLSCTRIPPSVPRGSAARFSALGVSERSRLRASVAPTASGASLNKGHALGVLRLRGRCLIDPMWAEMRSSRSCAIPVVLTEVTPRCPRASVGCASRRSGNPSSAVCSRIRGVRSPSNTGGH